MLRDLERVLGWIMAVACCAVAVLTYLALTREARGQAPPAFCAPRSMMADQLSRMHQEKLVIQAQAENGSVMEIYATDDGRTWTLVRVGGAFNNACVVAYGQYMEIKAGALSGRGM